jgi:hypothetical protein
MAEQVLSAGYDTRGRGKMNMVLFPGIASPGKMRPGEAIPGTGERRITENDRGSEFKYDIFNIL